MKYAVIFNNNIIWLKYVKKSSKILFRNLERLLIDHYHSKRFIDTVDNKNDFIFLVPLDERNKQFYNQIYTGQKVSFGRMHKEYQG